MAIDQVDDLLTVKEAASLLKISPMTIKRYIKQGRLHGYQVGPRAIRIRKEDLLQDMVQPTEARERSSTLRERITITPPTPEELARRRKLGKEILELRAKASIAPMTTAELVRLAREESTWYGDDC